MIMDQQCVNGYRNGDEKELCAFELDVPGHISRKGWHASDFNSRAVECLKRPPRRNYDSKREYEPVGIWYKVRGKGGCVPLRPAPET